MIDEKRFSQYNKTYTELKNQNNIGSNKFRAQIIGNNVEMLAGVDGGKYALSVTSDEYNFDSSSTSLIKVKKIKLKDGKSALIFKLMDDDMLSIFISFCIDLESMIKKDPDITVVEVYNRYLYWQKMFKVEKNKISESLIKGLFGELNLLLNYLIPKYGISKAIKGWSGSDKTAKDFAYDDGIWYETKSINTGKVTVKISSLEQLQSEVKGLLVITELEKTSSENSGGVRLFDFLNFVKSKIDLDSDETLFYDKVFAIGIPLDVLVDSSHYVNLYRYIVSETKFYKVDEEFPRLEKMDLPPSIGAVSYDLIVSELEEFSVNFT